MEKKAFLLVGDPFLVEEKFKSFLQALEKKVNTNILCESYDFSETPIDKILIQARTPSFFAGVQVFRLKNADALKKSGQEALATYLSEPASGTYMFFESSSLEKSDPLVKVIQKFGEVHFLEDQEKKSAARRFVQEKLQQSQKQMTPEAFTRLLEEGEDHPVLLDSMVDRLIHYAGEKSQITEEMVDTFREIFQSVNAFELTEAIAAKQTGKALKLLFQYMEDNPWVGLVGLLHWQIRRLWQAKILEGEGLSESEIARRSKISPRQIPFLMRQLKRFTRDQLEKALEELFRLDWKIKTGRAEEKQALEAWVVQTASA